MAVDGKVTGYLAVEPGATEAVGVEKLGGAGAANSESTSNCIALEVPPPGKGDCTVMG